MDSPIIQPTPLSLSDYDVIARKSDKFVGDEDGLRNVRFGYFGEIGSLLTSLKKVRRDQLSRAETAFVAEELGDALWYLMSVASFGGIRPSALGEACASLLRKEYGEVEKTSYSDMTFRTLDALVAAQGQLASEEGGLLLGELAYTAGVMLHQDREQADFRDDVSAVVRLGRLLGLLTRSAAAFSLRLEDIARKNLDKIRDRWPSEYRYCPLFDEDPRYPPHERFEREFDVLFEERPGGRRPHVVQSINGVFVGDRLTDNRAEPDGYRFHDVFHLAYVAHLGWSPVIRGLLKRKRKSVPEIDENEDGARAMIIEEGIATWIFNHADQRGLYEHINEGKLDYELLKQIRSMVDGYEVDKCPLWQWERAILQGFSVFRRLKDEGGGLVKINMNEHTITFESIRGKES